MTKIRLFTSIGRYVITVNILSMNPMPEVIQWGSRIFIKHTQTKYTEGLLVVVLPENEEIEDNIKYLT